MALVAIALVVLFGMTELLARGYRAARNERAESHARRGQGLREKGRYRDAAGEYRAALTFSPRNEEYRLALALSLLAVKDRREAERHLVELRQVNPASGMVNLLLARIDNLEDRTDAAEAGYHRAIYGYWPEDPQGNRLKARFELVALYDRTGERQKLLSELLQAAAEAPPEPDLKNRIGHLLLGYGAPQQAADVFRESAKLDDTDPEAWTGLGEAERAMGSYRSAMSAFRAALRRAPRDPLATRLLAETSEVMGLDPAGARLSGAERRRRSRELLARVLVSLESCDALPAEAREEVEEARKAVAAPRPPRGQDDTPELLELAEVLWQARAASCGGRPQSDQIGRAHV